MDKLISPGDQYEMQKVENQLSPRTKYMSNRASQDYSDRNRDSHSGIEVCIFLMGQVGVNLELDDGHIATADELLHLVAAQEEIGLSPEASSIFSLWFTSHLLEIQLKPHHLPYNIRQQWGDLLSKYTKAQSDEIDRDEPILSFQRSVFYSKKDEMKIQDQNTLQLLYEEAKYNVLEGRYPCEEANCYMLAGLQARIELGSYNPEIHVLDFFRSRITEYLPEHACKPKWPFLKLGFIAKNGSEACVLEQFRNLPSHYPSSKILRKYLEFCWTLPYYGAAFFRGQIEKPARGLAALLGSRDIPVLVAINWEGIFVISQAGNTVLLGLKYDELSWDFAKPNPTDENPNSLPCLFLQFEVEESGRKFYKLLQIFSKQAIMMDALIAAFVELLKQQKSEQQSEVDGNITFDNMADVDDVEVGVGSASNFYSDALVPLTKISMIHQQSTESFISNKLHRLSLATYNEEGECVNQVGSWSLNR